jgi:hypothetical protein
MKTITLLFIVVALSASCAKRVAFLPSTTVPQATGAARIKKDKNENYTIRVNVRNLPDPDDLQPRKERYTVWLETRDNRAINIGNVESSKGLFSKTRKGELETVTASKPVRVFITPEDESTPQIPGAEPVLSTTIFKIK